MKKIILLLILFSILYSVNAQSDFYRDENGMRYVEYEKPTTYELAQYKIPKYKLSTKHNCYSLMELPLDSLYEKTITYEGRSYKYNRFYLISLGTPKIVLKGRNLENYGTGNFGVTGYHTIFYLDCRYLPVIIIKGSVYDIKESIKNNEDCYIFINRDSDGYLVHKFILHGKEYDIVNY